MASMTTADAAQARRILDSGGPSAMYQYLKSKGFRYAELADGVATGDSVAGDAALRFMQTVADEAGKPLSPTDVDVIRHSMADAYLRTLVDAVGSDGTIQRDVTAQEAWNFHSQVFDSMGLDVSAWTLDAVFQVLADDASRQSYWEAVLNSAGNPVAEVKLALDTHTMMSWALGFGAGDSKGAAEGWLDNADTPSGAAGFGWSALSSFFDLALSTVSPIVLDLDGNGIDSIGLNGNIKFDHDGDGLAESTGWVSAGDGILVLDRNGNGSIDNGGELFGNNTFLSDGSRAHNGFVALADLDTNLDGVLDDKDDLFRHLLVWRDANGNGKSDGGELLTLENLGVKSLNLGFTNVSQTSGNGNYIFQTSSYVNSAGAVKALADIWLASEKVFGASSGYSSSSGFIKGAGKVGDFSAALSRDTTGKMTYF